MHPLIDDTVDIYMHMEYIYTGYMCICLVELLITPEIDSGLEPTGSGEVGGQTIMGLMTATSYSPNQ